MIGHGPYINLTARLTLPGIPPVGAAKFSDALYRRCRCRLAWHRVRRVFVVYRHRGECVYPRTYMDLAERHWPLNSSVLEVVCDVVRWIDARTEQDPEKMLEVYNRQFADERDQENRSFVAERFPDFWKDMNRIKEVITDGRYRTKFHDLAKDHNPRPRLAMTVN